MSVRFVLSPAAPKGDVLALPVAPRKDGLEWLVKDAALPAEPLRRAHKDGFLAKRGETALFRVPNGRPAERCLLIGAGEGDPLDAALWRHLASAAARRARDAGLQKFSFHMPDSTAADVQAAVEGVLLGLYRFQRYLTRPAPTSALKEVRLAVSSTPALAAALRKGEAFADAVCFARDWINEPPSRKTPDALGRAARALGRGPVKAKVFGLSDLRRMKMEALLGVNRGSVHPPVLIHLAYKPAGKPRRRLAFVGKGITFDSGGLCLKTADGMSTMKYDMAGAAAVISLFRALPALKPPVEVHGIAAVTENMPGADAYKPGDVLRAAGGKTIEVLNTDAEGRLVLADALTYAGRLGADEIIDLATLTGAATVALGKAYVALMANDDALVGRLEAAAKAAGEKLWRLPLEHSYKEHLKSKVADLKNIGNPGEAGTIIGGLFLQEFAHAKPWAHLDIAAAGWNADTGPLSAPGGNGVMVRTMLEYIGC